MFESLSERIHQDEAHEESSRVRMTRYFIIAFASAAVVVAAAFLIR